MKTMRLLWLSFTFVTAVVTWPAVAWPTTRQTTESPGLNLNGKMLTLSNYGGVSFSLPHYHPPIATSSCPYHTTSRPYHTTSRPYHTSSRPYHTTSRPYHTTSRPYHTSSRPYHTTSRPYHTTSRPYHTTSRPYHTTSRPYHTSSRPYHTTSRPYHTTSRPYHTSSRPYHTTSRPYHTTSRPYHTTSRPYHTTSRPYHTSSRPYHTTSRPYHTTSRPYHTSTGAWTTAPVTGGVSVCLRYLADSASLLFTLSPSRSPLTFFGSDSVYWMSFPRYSYNPLDLSPKIPFWANPAPDIWTRVCFTVDSGLQVAQVFSGSNFSIRKMLPAEVNYVWSGEPVIDFPGFDGQLTDVQVWDYPLSYKEVFNYMMGGIYLPYRGSALSWSYISYSPRGRTLLEDNYELQARRPISSLLRKHRPKGGGRPGGFPTGGRGRENRFNETRQELPPSVDNE